MPTTRFQAEEIVVTATRRGAQTNAYVISNLPAALNRGMGGFCQAKTIGSKGW